MNDPLFDDMANPKINYDPNQNEFTLCLDWPWVYGIYACRALRIFAQGIQTENPKMAEDLISWTQKYRKFSLDSSKPIYINDLELSTRLRKALESSEIPTLQEFVTRCSKYPRGPLVYRNLGKKSLKELVAILHDLQIEHPKWWGK